MHPNHAGNSATCMTPYDKLASRKRILLRAGENAFRVLLVQICEIKPVSEETGRWSRMWFDSLHSLQRPRSQVRADGASEQWSGANPKTTALSYYGIDEPSTENEENERRISRCRRIYHENRSGCPDAHDDADDRLMDGHGSDPVSQNWTNGTIRLGTKCVNNLRTRNQPPVPMPVRHIGTGIAGMLRQRAAEIRRSTR